MMTGISIEDKKNVAAVIHCLYLNYFSQASDNKQTIK